MSDQPPPPKSKPGSLRDRIAAFEKSSAAATPAPAPAPRPKPAGFQSWKPKAPTPPDTPNPSVDNASTSVPKAGGMSASDAKESINKAGSLKDRMAALQGKGAFGAPPVPATKPQIEKPKWKPPPVVHAPVDEDDGEKPPNNIAAAVERTLSPPTKPQDQSTDAEAPSTEPATTSEATEESAEVIDAEEEERQRRAAIAARMARLGGARVGMAPPVFAKKPVRRPTQESEDPGKTETPSSPPNPTVDAPIPPPVIAADASTSPPARHTTSENDACSPEITPVRRSSESVSILSADSADSQASRTPTAMPMSSVPRRAGPPRKKPTKAVPPPPPTEESLEPVEPVIQPDSSEIPKTATSTEGLDTAAVHPEAKEPTPPIVSPDARSDKEDETEVDHLRAEALSASSDHAAIANEEPALQSVSALSSSLSPQAKSSVPQDEEGVLSPPPPRATPSAVDDVLAEDASSEYSDDSSGLPTAAPVDANSANKATNLSAPEPLVKIKQSTNADKQAEEEEASKAGSVNAPTTEGDIAVDDAESEDARKKRVAERIAKMGGVNPFAAPSVAVAGQTSRKSSLASPPIAVAASVPLPLSPPTLATTPSIAESAAKSEVADEPSEASLDDESEVEDAEDIPDDDGQHEYGEAPLASSLLEHQPEQQGNEDSMFEDQPATEESTELSSSSIPSHPAKPLSPARPAQPPRRIIPETPEPVHDQQQNRYSEDDSDRDSGDDDMLAQSHLYIPPPTAQRSSATVAPSARYVGRHEDGNGSESDTPALPYLQRRSTEISPPRARSPLSEEDVSEPDTDHDGQALPIPPRQPSGLSLGGGNDVDGEEDEAEESSMSLREVTPMVSISTSNAISDDEQGDPIDPSFHSPSRSPSISNLRGVSQVQPEISSLPTSAPAPELSPPPPPSSRPAIPSSPPRRSSRPSPPSQQVQQVLPPPPPPTLPHAPPLGDPANHEEAAEEDEEHARRRTIAERMAKLGGIKFGAAPSALPKHRPPPPAQEVQEADEAREVEGGTPTAQLSEEDEERARKKRIAAKMANMGGMRIGMLPMSMAHLPQQRSQVPQKEDVAKPPPPPPAPRAVPPSRPAPRTTQAPPPVAADTDSEYSTEDGVKVEAEESDVDEVTYDDVQEEQEETPPPVPSRTGRAAPHRQSTLEQATLSSPTASSFRPPVPITTPTRKASGQTVRSERASEGIATFLPSRRAPAVPAPSDFVMVDEPETNQGEEVEAPPPPPPRPTSRLPPSRSSTIPHAPVLEDKTATLDSTGDWELPSIPTSALDFGGGADLSLSWTDAGESVSPTVPSHPPPQLPAKAVDRSSLSEKQQQKPLQTLSADELMAVWGRVGVQICEAATTMFEKSKKGVVGDGTYMGFVTAVFAMVPNATQAYGYGYLVYMQNGSAVQKRASDIMPGDVVEIRDAKFKGHKGLQTYQQHVGADGEGPLVGVVGEFEAKKTKIRVFQANHHVGQQTVESISYRLEDLKSGVVKVYRVLEA